MLQDLSQGHYATSNVTSNHSNAADYSVYSDFGSFTKVPNRPPPPKSSSSRKVKSDTSSNVGSTAGSNKVPRRPPHPPKLQHILKGDGKCHDLVKATPRYVIPNFSVANNLCIWPTTHIGSIRKLMLYLFARNNFQENLILWNQINCYSW